MDIIVISSLVVLGLIIIWLVIKAIFRPIAKTISNIFKSEGRTTITPKDVMTNGVFDPTKFNTLYTEIKNNRRERARKKEEELLKTLNDKNEQQDKGVLNMTVYDILMDYSGNMYGLSIDVLNGQAWYHNRRLLYLGWTLVIISLVYFLLNII